jgi:steroid delta-isomerase-like uncharacterized protein
MSSSNAAIIHRLYEECLNQGHFDLLAELVTEDVTSHGPGGDTHGRAAYTQGVERVGRMFPDRHFSVDDVITDGDKAAARWTLVATNSAPIAEIPPTGKPITEHAVVFFRFRDGKIAEVWVQMDQLGVLRQIGVTIPGVPAPQPAAH